MTTLSTDTAARWTSRASLLLFLSCLALPAYYTGNAFDPERALAPLIWGWLGPLDGHFAWYANLFYVLAWRHYQRSPGKCQALAWLAVALALSFLLYPSLLKDEGGGRASITGYGWGYALWVLSLAALALAAALKTSRTWLASALIGAASLAGLGLFVHHHQLAEDSLGALSRGRDAHWTQLCNAAGERSFAAPSKPVTSLYFGAESAARFSKFMLGRYTAEEWGEYSSRGLPQIEFTEQDARGPGPSSLPYLRLTAGRHPAQPSADLRSTHRVVVTDLGKDLPPTWHILARKVQVFENGRVEPLGETVYAISRDDHRFCGARAGDEFDEIAFVFRTLQLR